MIGRPLTDQEWNDEFRTDAGQKIIEALMPFHERMPELGRPPANAESRLREGLAAIGTYAKEIVIVSVSDLRASAPIIRGVDPESLGRGLVAELSEEIRRKQKAQLGDMLDKWHAAARGKRLGGLVREVSGTLHRSLFADVFKTMPFAGFMDSKYLTYVRQFNMQRCLNYQVALLIAGDEAATAIGQFCSLLASGVTPLALLQDDVFIAVSA